METTKARITEFSMRRSAYGTYIIDAHIPRENGRGFTMERAYESTNYEKAEASLIALNDLKAYGFAVVKTREG